MKKRQSYLRRWYYQEWFTYGLELVLDLPLEVTEEEALKRVKAKARRHYKPDSLRRGGKVKVR